MKWVEVNKCPMGTSVNVVTSHAMAIMEVACLARAKGAPPPVIPPPHNLWLGARRCAVAVKMNGAVGYLRRA